MHGTHGIAHRLYHDGPGGTTPDGDFGVWGPLLCKWTTWPLGEKLLVGGDKRGCMSHTYRKKYDSFETKRS